MNDDVRKKADEAFQKALDDLEGDKKPKSATPLSLSAPAISGGTLCDKAPALVKSAIGLLDSFSWFIPDNIETPLRAFLTVLQNVIMPAFCGTAPATGTPVKTNVSQTAR